MNVGFISLGCSKNLVDSENFIGILVNKKGFEVTFTSNPFLYLMTSHINLK